MNKEQIQFDISCCNRPMSSFTHDELLLAFEDSLRVGFDRRAQLTMIDKHILPRVYGDDEIEFQGKNCDECSGWDGMSKRCNCGNRRVSWDIDHGYPVACAD